MVNTNKLPPRLTACITVCDARITSIIAVPEYVPPSISDFIAKNKVSHECSSYLFAGMTMRRGVCDIH